MMKYKEVLNLLNENIDEKYKSFHSSLIPGEEKILGVRIPVLRKIAKEIRVNGYEDFFDKSDFSTIEEKILKGLIIVDLKIPFDEKLKMVEEYIPLIENWATNDIVSSSWKEVKKNRAEVYLFLQKYLKSEKEFENRFGITVLMSHFMEDEYIDRVLEIYENIVVDKYYSQMGLAWAVQVAFVKHREKTIELLKRQKLDKFTQNKAIQKIRESFRVTKEDKELVLKYKIK